MIAQFSMKQLGVNLDTRDSLIHQLLMNSLIL